MFTMIQRIFVLAVVLVGCGDSSPVSTVTDAAADTSDAAARLPKVTVTVTYTGAKKGPLAVGLFTENPPKSKPPVKFDTTNTATFPYVAELRDVEPGKYWAVAVLDLPPLAPGAVKPGDEDLQGTSVELDVVAGKDLTTAIVLQDKPADAGSD